MGQAPQSEPVGMNDLPRGFQRDREAGRPVRSSDDDPSADAGASRAHECPGGEGERPAADPRGDGPRDASPADPDADVPESERAPMGDTAYGGAVE